MDILPNIDMKIEEKEDLNKESEPESEPEPEQVKLKQEDIFVNPPKIKAVKEPKKKRVLTEEHKKKLQEARVKALEVRRANASMKKEMKDLEKQAKQQQLQELRDKVKPKKQVEIATPVPDAPPEIENEYREPPQKPIVDKPSVSTELDLEKISLNAIINYEKIRKVRKKKKKEDQAVQREQHQLRQQLHRAVSTPQNPIYSNNGHWDDFF